MYLGSNYRFSISVMNDADTCSGVFPRNIQDKNLEQKLSLLLKSGSLSEAARCAVDLSNCDSHSNPNFAKMVRDAVNEVFESLIARRSEWSPVEVVMNCKLWELYLRFPDCYRLWSCVYSKWRRTDFDVLNEIVRRAIGVSLYCYTGPFPAVIQYDSKMHEDLAATAILVCVRALLHECRKVSDPSIKDLQYILILYENLIAYGVFAGDDLAMMQALEKKFKNFIDGLVYAEVGKAHCALAELRESTIGLPIKTVVLPWPPLSGQRCKLKTWSRKRSFPSLLVIFSMENYIFDYERVVWDVVFSTVDRVIIVSVGDEIVGRFEPDPVVLLAIDLFLRSFGFGMTRSTSWIIEKEKKIENMWDEGRELLEKTPQWGRLVMLVAESVSAGEAM